MHAPKRMFGAEIKTTFGRIHPKDVDVLAMALSGSEQRKKKKEGT